MIAAVAFCPHPPVLVPEVAAGAADELDGLRAACDEAVNRIVAAKPSVIVLLGADGPHGGLSFFGVRQPVPGAEHDGLPLSLTIGRWLLHRAGWDGPTRLQTVPGDGVVDEADRVGLLVLGDGSARRSVKGPGYLDPRAEPFDASVAAALAAGDPEVLTRLDAKEAAELLVAGYDAWQAFALLAGGSGWRAELLYDEAPYGVGYFVASWLPE